MAEFGLGRLRLRPDRGELLAPEIVAERCVHTHLEQATCKACVDACPRSAVVLDDERLGVDTARCDACGLCAPACPRGAVADAFAPAIYRVGGTSIAFAACERALPVIGEPGIMPCVHALGLRQLLSLRREGVGRLVLSHEDCETCTRGSAIRIDAHLDAVRQLLEDRDQAALAAVVLAPELWLRAREAARRQPEPGLDRRAFFRQAIGSVAEQVARRAQGGEATSVVPPGFYFPTTSPGQVVPYVPRIDEERCTGCDACARLCPDGAIRVEPDAYRLDPDACTGCMVCSDVCAAQAVSVWPLAVPVQTAVILHSFRCRACGVAFHTPKPGDGGDRVCPVCTRTNRHRQLFQVQG